MSENPYQTPTVSEVAAPAEPLSNAAEIRQEHLHCEASIKGFGTLLFLGGALTFLSLVGILISGGLAAFEGETTGLLVLIAIVPLQFFTWWGLRKLRPWAKIPAGIISFLGLFAFGFGTIISIYFLYLLFGKKGRMVLSPGYQEIIVQTPGMKYRTPLWNWIVLAVIVILIVGATIYFSIG